jgi:hypothetical protein
MKTEQIKTLNLTRSAIAALNKLFATKAGTFRSINYKAIESQKNKSKGNKDLNLHKIRSFQCRVSINGDKTKEVQENREFGNQPKTNQGLKNGNTWISDMEGILLKNRRGEIKVRTYRKKDGVQKTSYFVDDREVSKEVYNSHLNPSALKASTFSVPYRDLFVDQILV